MPAHPARPRCCASPLPWPSLRSRPTPAAAQNRLPSSAEIDTYLTSVVRDTRIPGIVALVVDADRVVYTGAFGRQDVAGGVPMADDTIFRIASMTKPVTSVAVMMLVQEGDIGLDDPVSDYLPAFEDEQVIENFNAGRQELHDAPGRDADDGAALADAHVGLGLRVLEPHAWPRSSAPSPARAPRASRCCTIPARVGPTARARACSARSSRKCRGRRSTSSCPSASSCRSA